MAEHHAPHDSSSAYDPQWQLEPPDTQGGTDLAPIDLHVAYDEGVTTTPVTPIHDPLEDAGAGNDGDVVCHACSDVVGLDEDPDEPGVWYCWGCWECWNAWDEASG